LHTCVLLPIDGKCYFTVRDRKECNLLILVLFEPASDSNTTFIWDYLMEKKLIPWEITSVNHLGNKKHVQKLFGKIMYRY
jgi:hypothetical protein